MTRKPTVTTIVPAHNAAATIEETLDSLAAQAYPFWEAVVVDDGSTDDTAALVLARASHDPRIQLLQTAWQGLPAARNAGLDAVRGRYVHCLDADDVISPTFYEAVMAALDESPESERGRCAVCGYRQFFDDGRCGNAFLAPTPDAMSFEKLARHNFGPPLCFVFEKTILDGVGRFDEGLPHCQDWDLWLRFVRSGVQFVHVDGVHGRYRIRDGSLSRNHVRFVEAVRTVLLRTTREDDRIASAVSPPLDRDCVEAGLPALWHYSLLKAASEGGGSLNDLFSWAHDHLPERFWERPEAFGVAPGFQLTESVDDEASKRDALMDAYARHWPSAFAALGEEQGK